MRRWCRRMAGAAAVVAAGLAAAALATVARSAVGLLGDDGASRNWGLASLRRRLGELKQEPTSVAIDSIAGSNVSLCSNKCYHQFGFTDDDCQCVGRFSWYIWVCTSRLGSRIQPQYCGGESCDGCSAEPSPSAGPAPDDGAACGAAWHDCTNSGCCATPGFKCYAKHDYYAECRNRCKPGIHYDDPRRYWTPWTCEELGRTPDNSSDPSGNSSAIPPAAQARVAAYNPANPALLHASSAPVLTFYMYRVQNDMDYAPENQNTANLAGALWYLHNEIVNNRLQRRYGKTRIQRFKIQTRATQPLLDAGMNFGIRYAFDAGNCTGPFNCTKEFEKYGYFVGCNRVDDFPTQQWRNKVFYPNATWYSLPGKCNNRRYDQHDEVCEVEQPGGACDVVTGAGNCTFSYESAGEISIDELEGIESFKAFASMGGWEYNNGTDRGVHMTFWDDKLNATACQIRLSKAESLFRTKYPDAPTEEDFADPVCDFSYGAFFAGDLPE